VLKDQKDQISSIYFSNDLQCVAIASLDGSVFLYNIITGKKLRVYYHEKRMPIDEVKILIFRLSSLPILLQLLSSSAILKILYTPIALMDSL
jgi:hypothetical protein